MRKKDEMEQKVANKALKITWSITILTMFIIGIIQRFLNDGEGNILLTTAILSTTLLLLLEQYYLSKMNENKTFKRVIIATFILSAIILSVGFFLNQ